MEHRQLGNSGLMVSVLTMGTMTFGGKGNFAKVGNVSLDEVRRLIDIVADAGVNLIDTANVYSGGRSEEMLGEAMPTRKPGMLIATKARFAMGEGSNDRGLSRWHLIRECEASLKRLRTDVIDLYQVHQWDGLTPLEETMEALDLLVRAGKVRYIGCSNYSGWHIMKAMEVARREHRVPFVSEQIHYTLQARDAEYELLPIAVDQKLGVLVWSSARRRSPVRQASPQQGGPRRLASVRRLDRAAGARRERALGDRRPTGCDWGRARRLGGADRAGLASGAAGRDVARHRRPHRGAVPRQPRLGQRQADRRRTRASRQGERATADLPLLASVLVGEGPLRPRRPHPAQRPFLKG